MMNGAGIYETAVIIPKWSAFPPHSLGMFKAPYGLNLKTFWIVLHSFHEAAFICTIIFCWDIVEVRNWLLTLFAIHFLTRAWTILYFAPGVMALQKIANSSQVMPGLVEKARLWRTLNYVRTGIFFLVSVGFIPLCIKVLDLKFTGNAGF